jgi:hypothetical protein
MRIVIYYDGKLIARERAQRLDVTSKSLMIYGLTNKEEPAHDYFYFGAISFVMHSDELRIDLFEPVENEPAKLHHIRITAFDW